MLLLIINAGVKNETASDFETRGPGGQENVVTKNTQVCFEPANFYSFI